MLTGRGRGDDFVTDSLLFLREFSRVYLARFYCVTQFDDVYFGFEGNSVSECLSKGKNIVNRLDQKMNGKQEKEDIIAQFLAANPGVKRKEVALKEINGKLALVTIIKDKNIFSGGNRIMNENLEALLPTNEAHMQSILENMPTNVLLADQDLKIVYANPASIKTLKKIEQHIPCRADEIVGQNIEILHKDPSLQRKLLAGDGEHLPIDTVVDIGPENVRLLVSPVRDEKEKFIGPMVTWELITKRVNQDKEQARLRSMVENATTNMMMADKDFNITYVNPASIKTLKQVEQYLPCRAEDVVGQSIDIFHKDPSHQRRVLSGDGKNLPVDAVIDIGPEKANLLVSAMRDHTGEYLGPMVIWSLITDKVQMYEALKNTSESLATYSGQLNTSSQQLAAGAEQTTQQASTVAAATEEAQQNVQTVASSSEEMTASIKEISKNVQEAHEITAKAVTMADQTNETINKLGESSKEIGKVVKVITSIATQTNLLALNATIEAARAGEAGKGFAVVANEVKELAKQTANATEEISAQIEAIQKDTSTSVEAIQEIGGIIGDINSISTTIAGAVEEQATTTNEISRNIQEIATGSKDISSNIAGVAESAKDTGQGASSIKTSAQDLSNLAMELSELVNKLQI